MSYTEDLQKELDANREYNANQGGDWFKFKEGDNTFRILQKPVMFFEKFQMGICYTDCGYQGTPKLLTRVLDRADGRIKMAKIPFSKGEELFNLENDADYGFSEFPMPYDITIKAQNAGTKEVAYSAPLPRPVKALPEETMEELHNLKPVEEVITRMKEKQKEKHMADGTWEKNQKAKAATHAELKAARVPGGGKVEEAVPYPDEDIRPDDIPF